MTLADQRRWSYRLALGLNVGAVPLNLAFTLHAFLQGAQFEAVLDLLAALLTAVVAWWIVCREARVRQEAEHGACDLALRQHALEVMRTSGGEITIDQPIRH